MSGHSKWANIKRKKEANDKVKATQFAKLGRAITLAVIEGGGVPDPENNVRLRLAIENAKSLNMPKDTIQRAIEKGAGPNKLALKEVIYEAFAPHGVTLIITAATDNSNRTHVELRTILEKNGGKMGNQGSVSYNFHKTGVVVFENADEALVFEFADKLNASDIVNDSNMFTVYIPFEQLGKVKDNIGSLIPTVVDSEFKPQTTVQLSTEEQEAVLHLIDLLEEMDDVQNVYSNLEFQLT